MVLSIFVIFLASIIGTAISLQHRISLRQTRQIRSSSFINVERRIHANKFHNNIQQLSVVEHLINCDANKMITDALNNDEYCLKPANMLLTDTKGFLEQVANFALLIVSYYALKRSANGIKEWNDYVDDSSEGESFNAVGKNTQTTARWRNNSCPLCNGTGKFSGQAGVTGVCELCGGSGIVNAVQPYNLPGDRKSTYLSDDPDEYD